MADPEILAINAKIIRGGKRRRIRKRAEKILLPEATIALLTPEAQEKYLAYANPKEVDVSAKAVDVPADAPPMDIPVEAVDVPAEAPPMDVALPSSAEVPAPQPGPSGTQSDCEDQPDQEDPWNFDDDDDDDFLDDFDNLVFVNYSDDEEVGLPSPGKKRQAKDMEVEEELDTSLNVKDLKKKSKKRQKVAKIRIVESDVEMEEN